MFDVRPSSLDPRDYVFFLSESASIKPFVDLRQPDVLIEDQGSLGSCTSNAIVGAYEIMLKKRYPETYVELSRLFVYYNTRMYYDIISEDSGAYLRDTLKALKKYGVCSESIWPYDVTKFDDQPTPQAYTDAIKRSINYYETLIRTEEILHVLSQGKPVVIGTTIFSEFQNLNQTNFVVPMPTQYDKSVGGHALCIVGYDYDKKQYIVKNSFGDKWGDNGYCMMSFEYVDTYAFEKWHFDITEQINFVIL